MGIMAGLYTRVVGGKGRFLQDWQAGVRKGKSRGNEQESDGVYYRFWGNAVSCKIPFFLFAIYPLLSAGSTDLGFPLHTNMMQCAKR